MNVFLFPIKSSKQKWVTICFFLNTQTSFIQEVINKPKKQRAKPKPIKVENRTLDLTITDTDIKNIIENNNTNPILPEKDNKLQEFINVLMKNK